MKALDRSVIGVYEMDCGCAAEACCDGGRPGLVAVAIDCKPGLQRQRTKNTENHEGSFRSEARSVGVVFFVALVRASAPWSDGVLEERDL
jgi:hypothetical protein